MGKRSGGRSRSHINKDKARLQREAREKLAEILEYGTEEDFVEAVKAWKPEIQPKELQDWIMLFRASVREKRGLD